MAFQLCAANDGCCKMTYWQDLIATISLCLFAFCSSCSALAISCRFFSSHTAARHALHTPSILFQSQRAVALSMRSLWSNTTECQAARCLCRHWDRHAQVHKCRVKGQITFNQATQMHSAGADLEIVDVNHGGFLLSFHLLSVGLLLLGAAQRGWLEAFGVRLNLHLFSFPGRTDTRISPAGRRHYCLSGN